MSPTREAALVARWREVLSCYSDLSCALDRDLQERHGIGMSDFEVLDLLMSADGGKVRMQELGERVYLSQSALSRSVARLEKRGLVTRAMCDQDRRALFVHCTEQGRTLHGEACPTHRALLEDRLGG
ncbi:MarR family winged helix-turn-helix transcriptional regulator [Nocardiopsis chromatogenes]|uniref:MarR family winged helix-turn-helix transcriptional regulator n=1 Tax=Nocardiopsis chromatogenes TaxID=280239 RepID=UPI0004779A1B|nr:MarR family transcriptional regulator [Nocardiopsis chromatogenes]